MNWFKDVNSIAELRSQYKALALKHHPDVGGNVTDMQEINATYDILFNYLQNNQRVNNIDPHKESEEDYAFREVLDQIITYNMTIEIIGSWLWCFDCYSYKDKLKGLGFKFAPKKKAWCWHYGHYRSHHKEEVSLDTIRTKYGSQKINTQKKHNKFLFS